MLVTIYNHTYNVIKELDNHVEYNGGKGSNLKRFLLQNDKNDNFILTTDMDFVFYLSKISDGKETSLRSGTYNQLKWEEELNETTML